MRVDGRETDDADQRRAGGAPSAVISGCVAHARGVGTGDSPVRLHAHRRRPRSIGATGSRSRPVRAGWARHDGDRREKARERPAGDPHRPTARSRHRPSKSLWPTGRSAGANGPVIALRHMHGTRADARRRDPLESCSSDAARVAVGEQQRNRLARTHPAAGGRYLRHHEAHGFVVMRCAVHAHHPQPERSRPAAGIRARGAEQRRGDETSRMVPAPTRDARQAGPALAVDGGLRLCLGCGLAHIP